MKKYSLALLILIGTRLSAQPWYEPADSLNKQRAALVLGSQALVFTGTVAALQFAWYNQYQSGGFHFFDDWDGWQQMDKAGHAATAYQAGLNLYRMNRWAGIAENKALWAAVAVSTGFQFSVEVMDGFSEGWGFSHGDILFNSLGSGVFLAQQLAWHEQRMKIKFSFWPSGLAKDDDFGTKFREVHRAEQLFGSGIHEQWLKDYNGQTYWFSANLWSLCGKPQRFPKWLNVAVGYSANNMLGATSNTYEIYGEMYTSPLKRERQFLLSLDLDLDNIDLPPYLVWIKPIFGVVKLPFPALEWNSARGLIGHPVYF